jgi:hypothetical protein
VRQAVKQEKKKESRILRLVEVCDMRECVCE